MTNNYTEQIQNDKIDRARLTRLKEAFARREKEVRERIRSKHAPHIEFLEKRGLTLENLRNVTTRKVALGAIAGSMVLNPLSAVQSQPLPTPDVQSHAALDQIVGVNDNQIVFANALKSVIPAGSENLTPSQEQVVSKVIAENLGVSAAAELAGYQLNRSFGLIGAEQHLLRYPGDSIFDQLKTPADFAMYGSSGLAPGLGAYGYFAPSKSALTPSEAADEKWYVVAQTFLAPGFAQNSNATAQFFKYRKFIVINPDTGQAVVGDLADAGPAEYTGKSFGGSPEVMNYLGYGGGPRKGRVIFFMVNDPQNKIPLGPVTSPFIQPASSGRNN